MVNFEDDFNKLLSDTIVWDVLGSITDAVVTVNEQHQVVYCNRAAEVMFGYSSNEMVGKDVSPLIPEPHHSVHRSYVNRFIATGIPRVIGKSRECVGQTRDGKIFPVEISYSVSKTGGRLYFTAVIRDISERREMEREIRFMERFADVGKAVAHVVHEIRKPLMLIGGFARQVEGCEALRADEKSRRKLGIVVDEVRRLETLLNGIRLLTRPPGHSEKRALAVHEVVLETLELLNPMLQHRRIEIIPDLSGEPLRVLGDPDQLKQVFLNLLQNAVEAMNGAGSIHITAGAAEASVRVTVRDNGPGVPEEMREKIFDPFFTTKSEGTGLGLAISRNIIHDHGGSISLVSSSRGSSFIVELPLATS